MQRERIVSLDVNITDIKSVTSLIRHWTAEEKGRSVCVANVHMCMEAFDDAGFAEVVNSADLVVADGRPLVWAQRLLGHRSAGQVRGEDLTLNLCEIAQIDKLRIGLFGGSNHVLEKLVRVLTERYPDLIIAYSYSPPFRPLSETETAQVRHEIDDAGVDILFVGLGCPKQERWMAANRAFVNSVMVGVGAAYDFIAGEKRKAPQWIQRIGLEWLLRLASEPRRLWRRYLKHNPRFLWHISGQIFAGRNTPSHKDR